MAILSGLMPKNWTSLAVSEEWKWEKTALLLLSLVGNTPMEDTLQERFLSEILIATLKIPSYESCSRYIFGL